MAQPFRGGSSHQPVEVNVQYDVRRFSGGTIVGAVKAHPDRFSERIADLPA